MNFDLNSPTRPVERNNRFGTIGRNNQIESPAELSDLLEETALDETVIESLYPVANPNQLEQHLQHQNTLQSRSTAGSTSGTILGTIFNANTADADNAAATVQIARPRALERVSSGTGRSTNRRRSIRRSNQFNQLEESLKNSENEEINVRISNFISHSTSERMFLITTMLHGK